MNTLRLGTYNIHKGYSYGNLSHTLNDMKANLKMLNLDALFIQEVRGEHETQEAQFETLADQLWPYYAYGKNAILKSGLHHGNAILSKYPFVHWDNIDVSPIPFASRSILHGQIKVLNTNIKIHFMCIHFGLFAIERKKQILTLCQRIRSHVPTHEPLIVAGDFNDWRHQAGTIFKNELQLEEVFEKLNGKPAKTFPSFMPWLCLDRIYFRGLTPTHCQRLNGLPWRKLSDHLLLMAEFQL